MGEPGREGVDGPGAEPGADVHLVLPHHPDACEATEGDGSGTLTGGRGPSRDPLVGPDMAISRGGG